MQWGHSLQLCSYASLVPSLFPPRSLCLICQGTEFPQFPFTLWEYRTEPSAWNFLTNSNCVLYADTTYLYYLSTLVLIAANFLTCSLQLCTLQFSPLNIFLWFIAFWMPKLLTCHCDTTAWALYYTSFEGTLENHLYIAKCLHSRYKQAKVSATNILTLGFNKWYDNASGCHKLPLLPWENYHCLHTTANRDQV